MFRIEPKDGETVSHRQPVNNFEHGQSPSFTLESAISGGGKETPSAFAMNRMRTDKPLDFATI